jgi:hypothetical protein
VQQRSPAEELDGDWSRVVDQVGVRPGRRASIDRRESPDFCQEIAVGELREREAQMIYGRLGRANEVPSGHHPRK